MITWTVIFSSHGLVAYEKLKRDFYSDIRTVPLLGS
jgi:hypothetical protein